MPGTRDPPFRAGPATGRAPRTPGDTNAALRSFRALLALCIVLPALLFAALAWYDYRQIMDAARENVATTTRALAEHAEKVFETNRLVLALMSDRVRTMNWPDIAGSAELHAFLLQLTREMPQIESVFYVSPEGFTAASSRAFPMSPFDVTQRDYFRAARAGNRGLFLSAPFVGQMARTTAFTVTQPLDPGKPDAGLAGITLSPAYFERFYQAVSDTPLHAVAALVRGDGTVLVRYPDAPILGANVGGQSLIAPALAARTDAGLVEGWSRFDKNFRLLGFQRIAEPALVTTYSVKLLDVLGPWFRHLAVLALLCGGLGAALWQAARAAMVRAREERAGLQRIVAETTRREQAEDALRQLQKIEALGRLTGGVAHDFNNLLTAVMGALELAQKRTEDPRVLRLLGSAMDAARRGASLTQHMLAFSRQQDIRMLPVSVNDSLRRMNEMLERTLGPAIRFRCALADDLWHATADATQLEVAVLNLAINARDAMPLGGDLLLETANSPAGSKRPMQVPDGDMVRLTVTDSGAGMTQDVLRRAVEPFFTTKDVGRGTGLGLSMVHGFARQAGGDIAITSAPGRGTSVQLYLRRAADLPETAAPAPQPEAAQESLRILVLDDDLGVRTLTAEMLRELGHHVIEMRDGESAIARVAAEPDLSVAVLDFAMPDMNGGEVARRMVQMRAGLPIVFVTGYAERSALAEWTARGYRLLNKPFTLEALGATIQAAVSADAPEPR